MTLVAYLEGLQVAILAVEHSDPARYQQSHPRAFKLITSVKKGNNVERFLVGRQFFTIFVMTLMAQVTSFPYISHLGINSVVWFIFIQTGLPGAMVVTTIGSLQPQLLAAKDPWKFMDLYGSYSVLQLCYGLEVTGICTHFAWMLITLLRNTVFVSDEIPKSHNKEFTVPEKILEFMKYVAVLPVPQIAVFIVFAFCIVFLAHLEGLQVAILVAEPRDLEPIKQSHPRAYALMERATYEKNVRRFLIGRQFFVIFVVFLINQCTIFPEITHFGINSAVWFVFVQLGFPTALNVLCFAQLPAQLLGNQ
ncbi:SIT, partial [Symbiodinium microadriaticum]